MVGTKTAEREVPCVRRVTRFWLVVRGQTEAGGRGKPGPLCFVFFCRNRQASPGAALRPGLVPAGLGALGGCLLARFGEKPTWLVVRQSGLALLHVARTGTTGLLSEMFGCRPGA